MDKKVKFFWVYTIILFSVAFVLILFSAFSGTRFQEEKSETQRLYQGAQKSLSKLTDEIEALRAQSEENKRIIEEITKRLQQMTDEAAQAHAKNFSFASSIEALLEAESLVKKKEYQEANDAISRVDQSILDGRVLSLYAHVKKQIDLNIKR